VKTCTKCGETKPLAEFSRQRRAKDGLQFQCKACRAVYNKAYREANAEETAARMRAWCQANPDYHKAWRDEHADEIAAQAKMYSAAHADEIAARLKAWRESNPEQAAAQQRRRRARLVNATVEDFDEKEVWERAGYACVYCGATDNLSIDHIKPLSKDGAHGLDNLCVACRSCNSSKGAKPLIGWLAGTERLDLLEQGGLL